MSFSIFCDKNFPPVEDEIQRVLGEVSMLWQEVRKYIERNQTIREEWKIYTKKAGWCKKILLVKSKEERNILFLYPNQNYFTAIMVYGDQAIEAIKEGGIPKDVQESILNARPYREGRSFSFEVRNPQELDVLKRLIDIKILN